MPCVVIFFLQFDYNICNSKKSWARCDHKSQQVFTQITAILVTLQWNFDFVDTFSKKTEKLNFMKIHPVAAHLFYTGWQTDGRTGVKKFIIAFRDFSKAPEIIKPVN
jgi:hypothetical protein